MENINKNQDILDKLASNEEYVARLYAAYAVEYPSYQSFWESLADEEIKHSNLIRSLREKANKGLIFIDVNRFNSTAIQSYQDYLKREISRVEQHAVPLIEALSITYYVEDSLLENRFFEIFKTDSAEMKNTLSKLKDETSIHRIKAKEKLEEYKSLNNF